MQPSTCTAFAPLVGIYGGTLEVFRNMIAQYMLGLGKPNYSAPVKRSGPKTPGSSIRSPLRRRCTVHRAKPTRGLPGPGGRRPAAQSVNQLGALPAQPGRPDRFAVGDQAASVSTGIAPVISVAPSASSFSCRRRRRTRLGHVGDHLGAASVPELENVDILRRDPRFSKAALAA